MNVELRPMAQAEAEAIAAWRYEPPYSFYDWSADAGDLAELLGAETRAGKYFSALDSDGQLIGFFGFESAGDAVVVGLGLRPDLTGRGLGLAFLEDGMAFARGCYAPSRFSLSVAGFNARAIRVYERAGFQAVRTFEHETNGGLHPFVEMERPA